MKAYGVCQNDYSVLVHRALAVNATEDDINRLGEWFRLYGYRFWNGEAYTIDECHTLHFVSGPVDEHMGSELIGFKIQKGGGY